MFELLQKKGSEGKIKKCNFNSKDAFEPKSLTALIDINQSGSQSPSSFNNPNSPSPKPSFGLNIISLKNIPSLEKISTKLNEEKIKSQKLCRAVNHQERKLELLNEIYQTDEYTKFTTKNKLIQCNINIDTPYKILEHSLSLLDKSLVNYERTVHPAYSNLRIPLDYFTSIHNNGFLFDINREDLYFEDQIQPGPLTVQNEYNVQYEIPQTTNSSNQQQGIIPSQVNDAVVSTYMHQSVDENALLQQNNAQAMLQQNEQVQLPQETSQGRHTDLFDSVTSQSHETTSNHTDHINESAFVDQQLVMLPASALNTQDTSVNPDIINGAYTNMISENNTNEQLMQLTNERDLDPDLFFVKEDGIYVRVDEEHFHRLSYIDTDGSIFTETDLKIELPSETVLPMITNIPEPVPLVQEQEQQILLPDQQSNQYISMDANDYLNNNYNSNNIHLIQENDKSNQDHNNNNDVRNNTLLDYQILTDLDTHTPAQLINSNIPIPQPSSVSSSVSRFSSSSSTQSNIKLPEQASLPPRPIPCMPFALHSQLLTPELSISITDKDRELMLTFDNPRRSDPQQEPVFYQIYSCSTIPSAIPHDSIQQPLFQSNKPPSKSHRKSNRSSPFVPEDPNVAVINNLDEIIKWCLLGEVQSYKLPMFCTINIPPVNNQEHTNNNSYLRYYFAIRSVDEYNRYSDWSNVVQVELADSL